MNHCPLFCIHRKSVPGGNGSESEGLLWHAISKNEELHLRNMFSFRRIEWLSAVNVSVVL